MKLHIQNERWPLARLLEMLEHDAPRTITTAAFETLVESVRRFGLVEPIVVNRNTRQIVSGRQRVLACEVLGFTEVPVKLVEMSTNDAKALALALNNPTLRGTWDGEKLERVMDTIQQQAQKALIERTNAHSIATERAQAILARARKPRPQPLKTSSEAPAKPAPKPKAKRKRKAPAVQAVTPQTTPGTPRPAPLAPPASTPRTTLPLAISIPADLAPEIDAELAARNSNRADALVEACAAFLHMHPNTDRTL